MKILLATGIFYPDVGGPAIHVRKIAERLTAEGYKVTVVAYGEAADDNFVFRVRRSSRKYPKPVQWLFYFFKVFVGSLGARAIYAFDPTAAGMPAALTSWVLHKPFLIRIGGDPIWERVVEKGKRFITIEDYYKQGLYKEDNPRLYALIKRVLVRAKVVVVYNQFFKNFYAKFFDISSSKIRIVKNPVFTREKISTSLSSEPMILFAGRFVAYKNLSLVLNVFARVRAEIGKGRLVLIGKGPDKDKLVEIVNDLDLTHCVLFIDSLPQEKLFEYIKESAIAIAPAINEFNPNFILEALSFGRPVLLSRGHGLSVDLPDEFLFDPFDADELFRKLINFLSEDGYRQALSKIHSLDLNQTWEDVTDFHISLIREVSKS